MNGDYPPTPRPDEARPAPPVSEAPPEGGGLSEPAPELVRRRLHRPLATAPLLVANLVVFLVPFVLGLIAWDSMAPLTHPLGVEMGASLGGGESLREPWRLITANFLHAGLIHLGCNMITLWSVGRWVESFLGPRRFLIVYVVAGMSAVAASSLASAPDRVSLGASGAVLGVAWGVIVLLFRIRRILPAGVATRSITMLSLMLSLPLILLPFFAPVDNWGHAGGSIAGAVTMALVPIGGRPGIYWSVITTLPLVAFVLIGMIVPIVCAVEVGGLDTRLTAVDEVEVARLRVAVGEDWTREDASQQITWTSSSGVRAGLEWDRVPRWKSPTVQERVERYEEYLEREKQSGAILDYRVFHREDLVAEGVGGIIAAYVVTIPGDGWLGWLSGRIEQQTAHAVRFFDGLHGSARLSFTGPDSAYGRELAIEFTRGVQPIR